MAACWASLLLATPAAEAALIEVDFVGQYQVENPDAPPLAPGQPVEFHGVYFFDTLSGSGTVTWASYDPAHYYSGLQFTAPATAGHDGYVWEDGKVEPLTSGFEISVPDTFHTSTSSFNCDAAIKPVGIAGDCGFSFLTQAQFQAAADPWATILNGAHVVGYGGGLPGGFYSTEMSISIVPEPVGQSVLLLGVVSVFMLRHWRGPVRPRRLLNAADSWRLATPQDKPAV